MNEQQRAQERANLTVYDGLVTPQGQVFMAWLVNNYMMTAPPVGAGEVELLVDAGKRKLVADIVSRFNMGRNIVDRNREENKDG